MNFLSQTDQRRYDAFVRGVEGAGDILVRASELNAKDSYVHAGIRRLSAIGARVIRQLASDAYSKSDWKLACVSSVTSQLLRVFEASAKNGNLDTARQAGAALTDVLAEAVARPKLEDVVEEALRAITATGRIVGGGQADSRCGDIATSWYVDVVLNQQSPIHRGFDFSYLARCDHYYSQAIRTLVADGDASRFKRCVGYLVRGVQLSGHPAQELYDYIGLVTVEVASRVRADPSIRERLWEVPATLSKGLESCREPRALQEWLATFGALHAAVLPVLDRANVESASRLARDIRFGAIGEFLRKHLLTLMFGCGAYAWFKKRPELIRILWEYKQPPDANAVWCGDDIVPTTLQELVRLYFSDDPGDRGAEWWEDHHGSEAHYRAYFCLSLGRFLIDIPADETQRVAEIEDFSLPAMRPQQYNWVLNEVPRCHGAIKEIVDGEVSITAVGFRRGTENLFATRCRRFVDRISECATAALHAYVRDQPLSTQRVAQFSYQVLRGYAGAAVLPRVFIDRGRWRDRTREGPPPNVPVVSVTRVEQKAPFLADWFSGYHEFGAQYGATLAKRHDAMIFNAIAGVAGARTVRELPVLLESWGDGAAPVVIATPRGVEWLRAGRLFESSRPAKAHLGPDLPAPFGSIRVGATTLSVYRIVAQGLRCELLIMDLSRTGDLVYFAPHDAAEAVGHLCGGIWMDVAPDPQETSAEQDLLRASPNRLRDQEDASDQDRDIAGRVRITLEIRSLFEPEPKARAARLSSGSSTADSPS